MNYVLGRDEMRVSEAAGDVCSSGEWLDGGCGFVDCVERVSNNRMSLAFRHFGLGGQARKARAVSNNGSLPAIGSQVDHTSTTN